MATTKKKCSFCGRSEDQVDLLITGQSGFICDACVQAAYSIVESAGLSGEAKEKHAADEPFQLKKVPKPKEIK